MLTDRDPAFTVIVEAIKGLPARLKPEGKALFWALEDIRPLHTPVNLKALRDRHWTADRLRQAVPEGWIIEPLGAPKELEEFQYLAVVRLYAMRRAVTGDPTPSAGERPQITPPAHALRTGA